MVYLNRESAFLEMLIFKCFFRGIDYPDG